MEKLAAAALLDEDFAEVFHAENLAGDGSPLLLCVSGGPDSTTLMHAAATWTRRAGGPPLLVATVDHGLRPEARAEAEAVGEQAAALGLPHAILVWRDPPAHVSQESAREARYRLLAEHAAQVAAARIATAHTLDDQVETILMRLADGSGLAGLAGMAPATRRGPLLHLRPFLHLRKAALVATCRARGWRFAEDPTNHEPRFARPRWRALATALAAEGLTPDRIARLGGRMRRADLVLEAMAERVAARVVLVCGAGEGDRPERGGRGALAPRHEGGSRVALDVAALSREPDEIGIRVLLHALIAAGAERLRLERVEAAYAALLAARLTGSPVRRTLAGHLLALDASGRLTIRPEPPRRRGR